MRIDSVEASVWPSAIETQISAALWARVAGKKDFTFYLFMTSAALFLSKLRFKRCHKKHKKQTQLTQIQGVLGAMGILALMLRKKYV